MKLYADTSALVKFFHSEAGTPIVSQLLENRENDIYISELAKIEFYCPSTPLRARPSTPLRAR